MKTMDYKTKFIFFEINLKFRILTVRQNCVKNMQEKILNLLSLSHSRNHYGKLQRQNDYELQI